MKTKLVAATLALAALLTNACEQHKWSETKELFKSNHGAEGDAHGHGDKAAEHGEKKADAGHGEAKH